MTQPTIAQLYNLTDRAGAGLTPDEQQRLRDGIDQLEALQQIARDYCPHCGRGDAAPTVEHWEQERQSANFWLDQHQRARQSAFDQQQRAKRAEAVVARVRAARDRIAHASNIDAIWCLDQLDDALDEPGPAATQATEPASLREQLAAAIDQAIEDDNLDNLTDFSERLTNGVLAAVTEHLDIGEEQAWCKTCRRAWNSPRHRCESDAEIAITQVRSAIAERRAEVADYEAENEPSAWSDAVTVTCNRIEDALRVFPEPVGIRVEPAHNDGPTVREAAADDRRWPLQKTGE